MLATVAETQHSTSSFNVDAVSEQAEHTTSCSLLLQLSKRSRCKHNATFGCSAGELWISRGCRGQFLCDGAPMQCGYERQALQSRRCSCAADQRNWHLNTHPAALRRSFGPTKMRGCTGGATAGRRPAAAAACVHRDALASFWLLPSRQLRGRAAAGAVGRRAVAGRRRGRA